MIVVDTSALVEAALNSDGLGKAVREQLADDPVWIAPAHQPLEFLQAMCGLLRGRRITEVQVAGARQFQAAARIWLQTPNAITSDRIWELRHNMTVYDAAYVAVAEVMNCPLVTTDTKFVGTPGPRCELRLIR